MTAPLDLQTPLRDLLGGRSAKALASKLELHTAEDLLRHYPRRYHKRGELTDLADLEAGENVTVMARVKSANSRRMRQRRGTILDVTVTDGTGELRLAFFSVKDQTWLADRLRDHIGLFSGQVELYRRERQLVHPEYVLLESEPDDEPDVDAGVDALSFAGGLLPIYPAAAKLETWKIQKAVATVLGVLGEQPDPLPDEVRARHGLCGLSDAFRKIHQPAHERDHFVARERLRFDEAFLLQVVLAQRRAEAETLPAVARRPGEGGLLADFDSRLPFDLTAGQQQVGAEIAADLAEEHPMHRLLQGEVGSGKTVVALRAMLAVVDSGGQAALLAPTEVLAQQHHRSISTLMGDLAERGLLGGSEHGTSVALLTGSQPTAVRRRELLDIVSGEAGIVVGTHALIQDKVDFHDLGLVVVDEQHRFGVEQRDALRAKARTTPHVLVMTATPIPRTVAMTVFGDLDVSTMTELPQGRAPIRTHVVPVAEKPRHLDRAWERIREEVAAGRQAFVVCPRIGEGDETDDDSAPPTDLDSSYDRAPRAVTEVAAVLGSEVLADLRIGVLHGRLPTDERDASMAAFVRGDLDVLVATTVVEVGVDVPTATVMVILDAERFGVSQLHQLRGRVGRGRDPALCLLVTDALPGTPTRERLDRVAETLDGFELSRLDLQTRREGDVLGATQSGRRSSLRLLEVIRHEKVIEAARGEATALVADDVTLSAYPALADQVTRLLQDERAEYLEKA